MAIGLSQGYNHNVKSNGLWNDSQYQRATGTPPQSPGAFNYYNPQPGGYVNSQGAWQQGANPAVQAYNQRVDPSHAFASDPRFTPSGYAGGGVPGGGGMYGQNTQSSGTDIGSILQRQMASNDEARKKQEDAWQQQKSYMMGLPGQYANDPLKVGSDKLTQGLLANPEAMNDQVMQSILNRSSNENRAAADNQYRQGLGLAANSGLTDAGSLSALRERVDRGAMANNQNQQTQLEIQRAQQRNQDIMNASNLGRQGAQANFNVPFQTGNSIMANQPQYRPDDYTGLLALSQQQQQNNTLNSLLGGRGMGGGGQDTFQNVQRPYGNINGRYDQSGGGPQGLGDWQFGSQYNQYTTPSMSGSPVRQSNGFAQNYGGQANNTSGMMPQGFIGMSQKSPNPFNGPNPFGP